MSKAKPIDKLIYNNFLGDLFVLLFDEALGSNCLSSVVEFQLLKSQ